MTTLLTIIHQFVQDLRYAVRLLVRSRIFTITAVACLALGIGGNTALFSVVRAVLWKPLPFVDADRIVVIEERNAESKDHSVALPNYDDWVDQQTTLEGMGAMRRLAFNLSGTDRPEHVAGAQVTWGVLDTLGVQPAHGRTFSEADDHPGAEPVAIISARLHDRLFDGEASAVGGPIRLDGRAFTLVGVLSPGFELLEGEQDVYVPLGLFRDSFPGFSKRGTHANTVVIGRIAPGLAIDEVDADLSAVAARLSQQYPETNRRQGVSVHPLLEHTVGRGRTPMLVLFGAVGLVLLIATANVAGLLVARALARAKEFGIRRALGASRGRLVRQLLTESLVLGVLGGAGGILVGAWGLEALLALLPDEFPRLDGASIDWVVLGFSAALSITVAVLFGLLPAAAVSREASPRGPGRVQRWLVTGEIALAVVLLAGAGLSLRSLHAMQSVELGFEPEGVLNVRIMLTKEKYPDAESWDAFFGRVRGRLAALPTVEHVAVGTITPMWQYTNTSRVHSEDNPKQHSSQMDPMVQFVVGPDFFEALGATVVHGRTFESADMDGERPVVVIDSAMAETYWPGQDPIGKRVAWGGSGDGPNWREVIGVVQTMQHYDIRRGQSFEGFSPLTADARRGLAEFGMTMSIIIRSDGELEPLAGAVRDVVVEIDPEQPVFASRPLTEIVHDKFAADRILVVLLATFAGAALLLASIGLYGVMSFTTARRTREIGIRIALGASPGDVRRLVLGQAARLAVSGLLVGLGIALLVGRALRSALYGVTPLDPVAYVATIGTLLAVAMLAAYLPARRAANIDPTTALRRD